jgi:heme-degrading monooxygenase HmoA
MIIVIVHHWCEPEKKAASVERIDFNGDTMAGVPGFLFRYRMNAPKDALQISTITAWQSEAAYQQWLEEKRARPDANLPNPYSRVENQLFVVDSSHEEPGTLAVLHTGEGAARV